MQRLVVASNNAGKIREFRDLLAGVPVAILTARGAGVTTFPPETGATFRANAVAKARFVLAATALPAIADDSGFVVDALGGAPGVYSARYGGPGLTDQERCALVLAELARIPGATRTARFVAAIACAFPDGTLLEAEGVSEGRVADEPRGAHGFGYDPLFMPDGSTRTFGEMVDPEKHAISHRGRALRALLPQLLARLTASEE